jgi:hypothetical protein
MDVVLPKHLNNLLALFILWDCILQGLVMQFFTIANYKFLTWENHKMMQWNTNPLTNVNIKYSVIDKILKKKYWKDALMFCV